VAGHGTASSYKHGCRCAACRAAGSEQQARWRRAALARPIPATVGHGLQSTYTNWACRCPPCRQAHSQATTAWHRQRQHRPTPHPATDTTPTVHHRYG